MANRLMGWIRSTSFWSISGNESVPGPGDDDDILINMCSGVIAKSKHRLSDLASEIIWNKKQCALLVKKLSETEETLAQSRQSSVSAERTKLALQELHQALLDADRLIQSSCTVGTEWLRAAIEQGDMKETFARALYEVQWHTEVLDSILVDGFGDVDGSGHRRSSFEPARCEAKLSAKDEFRLLKAVKEDVKALLDCLGSVKLDEQRSDLAHQLLEDIKAVFEDQVKDRPAVLVGEEGNGGRLVTPSSKLLCINPQNPKEFDGGLLLGRGSFGEVRVTKLLGGEYALKKFFGENTRDFYQEMTALQHLGRHPHIVRLICYSKNKSNSNGFLIMEKMETDLTVYLNQREPPSDDRKFLEAVVLMLQVAEGVRYIHSKHMAHRDLKPGNVLVNLEPHYNQVFCRAWSVKIADFGLSKTRNASKTYMDQTWNTGTTKYMAPEVIRAEGDSSSKTELNPMKADSYSFAIMCSEILTGEAPYGNLGERHKELKKGVKDNKRPNLPEDCPQRLKSLILRCWAGNFRTRPLFPKICQELRFIKLLLLRGDEQMLATNSIPSTAVKHQIFSGQSSGNNKGEQFPDVATSAQGSRQGPWGREEPHKKTGHFDHVADNIKWIRLKYQHSPPGVGFMEVGYVSGGKESPQAYCSNIIGTTWKKIDFEPDEFIKQVSGSVAPHEVTVNDGRGKVGLMSVVSLTIHTNRRSYGPFGDETTGRRFRSGTGKVFGFFGAGGVLLDKLGVWIIPDGQDDGDGSFLIEQ